ncbi:MAG TPA: hypothetical protein VMH92_13090 [Acidocella sp.]|nr:hypothetical protein [Acidocella sp.]
MQPENAESRSDQKRRLQNVEDAGPERKSGANRRQEPRRPVDSLTHMMRKSRVIFDDDGKDVQFCSILDASDNGYRISLTPRRAIDIGRGLILERADGSRMRTLVRWTAGDEIGMQIDWTYARIILDAAGKEAHVCKFLAGSEAVYRIEFNLPQKLQPGKDLILETANGVRHQARVQWIWETEIGLQSLKKIPPSPLGR